VHEELPKNSESSAVTAEQGEHPRPKVVSLLDRRKKK